MITDESGEYQEEPYLSAIDLTTGIDAPLLALPNYRDVKMSMSADGVALLFDQVIVSNIDDPQAIAIQPNKAITDGRLWLFYAARTRWRNGNIGIFTRRAQSRI